MNGDTLYRFVTEHPCCQLEQTIELVGRPRALDGSADLRCVLIKGKLQFKNIKAFINNLCYLDGALWKKRLCWRRESECVGLRDE
jgi:hypothetical protein